MLVSADLSIPFPRALVYATYIEPNLRQMGEGVRHYLENV